MLRLVLFLATNFAVILVAGIVMSLLGINQTNTGLDLPSLLVVCAIYGFVGSFISLLTSKWIAKLTTGTKIINNPSNHQEEWLLHTVKELADRSGIGMPEVGIFPLSQSNAFATGWNKNRALVAVSAGLLQRFDQDEIRAVLAHEIGHVANGDMVTLTLIQGVLNVFVLFFSRIIGFAIDRALSGNSERQGPGIGAFIATFIAQILLGILATMIVMWFSRFREFRADRAGATLASKSNMINALQHLQAETQIPHQMPDTLTAFAINSGEAGKTVARLFASHPPLEERIAALEQL
jgi:heat shock protein HtpX